MENVLLEKGKNYEMKKKKHCGNSDIIKNAVNFLVASLYEINFEECFTKYVRSHMRRT